MFSFEADALLVDDREDLIAILQMRFGSITGEMIEEIYSISDMSVLQRLILSAANAANWPVFVEDFNSRRNSYRILGEDFNPLRDLMRGREGFNGKEQE